MFPRGKICPRREGKDIDEPVIDREKENTWMVEKKV